MGRACYLVTYLALLVSSLLYLELISCEQIYIIPSSSTQCQIQPCMTLNEYAANTSQYSHTNTTTLILTPGHHTLDIELSLSNITDISISGQELDNVTITCFYPGRLVIMNVEHLYISMLRFEQCDNNEILSVDGFLLEDSVFTHGTSTTLVLNEASGEIRNVNIFDTSISPRTQRGAIYCNHSSVVINETIFERNNATDGGAVFVDSQNNVTIIDSIFLSNSVTSGGALFAKHYNNITLQSCKFMSNGFSGTSMGGAIVLQQSLLSVVNCSFQDNRASAGAVIFSQSQSEVIISNSFFTDNSVYLSGGVIHGEDGSMFMVELSEFTRNSAAQNGIAYGGVFFLTHSNLTVTRSSFEENRASIGGALSTEGSLLSVDNSAFLRNHAYFGGTLASRFQTNVSISNSFFIDNSAEVSGGVAYGNGKSSLTVELSEFDGNTASEHGGAFYLSECYLTINYSSFEKSSAPVGGAVYADSGSTVSVISSDFRNNHMVMNEQGISQGGAFSISQSNTVVTDSTFVGNVAKEGGVFSFLQINNASITNSYFSSNFGLEFGGVLYDINSAIDIRQCEFNDNRAVKYGGVLYIWRSYIELISNAFNSNRANLSSGAVYVYGSTAKDTNNSYSSNTAYYGGALSVSYSTMEIQFSSFADNIADFSGGAIFTSSNKNITIINSAFVNNTSGSLGGALMFYSSRSLTNLLVTLSTFQSNKALSGGAICIMDTLSSCIDLSSNMFYDNFAFRYGGGIYSSRSLNLSLSNSYFEANNAAVAGGAIVTFGNELNIFSDLNFTQNSGNGGTVNIYESETVVKGSTLFQNNKGSLTVIASEVTFNGTIHFINCESVSISNSALSLEQGGAISLFQSMLEIFGTCTLRNNSADSGGAIYAVMSRLFLQGNAEFVDNKAVTFGGGAYLYQSDFLVSANCTFERNRATENGGGVYSLGSVITKEPTKVYMFSSHLIFRENEAMQGGAVYLKGNAKLYTYKFQLEDINIYGSLYPDLVTTTEFSSNIAHFGGAIYIDDISSGVCNNDRSKSLVVLSECQFQTLAVYDLSENVSSQQMPDRSTLLSNNTAGQAQHKNIYFSNNTAIVSGDNIFGGLFDRCMVNPIAEVLNFEGIEGDLNGISYLQLISNIQVSIENSITSNPVQVCSCKNGVPDCISDVEPMRVKKGHTFYVSIIAVDQISNPISSTFQSYLLSTEGRLSEQPKPDNSNSSCHTLSFSISSPNNSETLIIYANGPCNDAVLSRLEVEVEFLPCHCPVGFMSADNDEICECLCDSMLEEHTTSCNSTTETFVKSDNSWIGFINEEDNSSLTVHMHCPYNYCKPPNTLISLRNSTYPLCNFSRKGILCGACMQSYSLSLGSSRCLKCPNYWPGTLVAIIIAALISGIVLIIMILVLNLTVAVGTINAVVFYANIIASNYSSFFFGSENSFQSVLTSWLNFNFGLDVCFFEGMDAYWKTWIKMVFPAYIIVIVVIIITLSECSDKFSHLIGKRNPVATLATLILLSYTTFLQVVIAAFSFAIVDFQNGSNVPVWLPDGNVKYLKGEHIALFIAAFVILLMVVPYTLLLFSWQWLLRYSDKKILHWITKNQKLRHFMEAYHAPYKDKHRYWTGLLLLVRVILCLVSASNVSGDPHNQLVSVVLVIGFLLLLKGTIVQGVYKDWPVDALETILLFNILAFAALTMYATAVNAVSQFAISLTSTTITVIALLIIIVYHVYAYILKPNGVKSLKRMLTSCSKKKYNLNQIRQTPSFSVRRSNHKSKTDNSRFNDILYVMTPPGTLDYSVPNQLPVNPNRTPPGTLDYSVPNQLPANPNRAPTFSSLTLPDPEIIELHEINAQDYSADHRKQLLIGNIITNEL